MREVKRAGIRNAVHVLMRARRDYDFANGLGEIVWVVTGDAILFGFVKPNNDGAVVFIGLRSHDHGNDLPQEIIALQDFCRVAGQPLVAPGERGVHVIELVRGDEVVVGYAVIGQVGKQLLQGRVLKAQRIAGGGIIASVAVSKENLGIVLGGVIVLVGPVELIEAARSEDARDALDGNDPLVVR